MIKSLLRPFSYLSIDHNQKWRVDWLLPLLLTTFSLVVICLPIKNGVVNVFYEGGLVDKILGFVQSLPGFYIAALAAIATFNRIDIDKTMPAPAPKIDTVVLGKTIIIELTRRRFLCSMFAFLTAQSFILIILSIFSQLIHESIKLSDYGSHYFYITLSFLVIYFIVFWQMVVVSFWGLYYLGDKLHQPDQ